MSAANPDAPAYVRSTGHFSGHKVHRPSDRVAGKTKCAKRLLLCEPIDRPLGAGDILCYVCFRDHDPDRHAVNAPSAARRAAVEAEEA
jgi:hypothetical protein